MQNIHRIVRLLTFILVSAMLGQVILYYTDTSSAADIPSVSTFNGVTDGQTIQGTVGIEAITNGENIDKVEFMVSGPEEVTHTEHHAPYFFFGDSNGTPKGWNTAELPDGEYKLSARAVNEQGVGEEYSIAFRIANSEATLDAASALNEEEDTLQIPGYIQAEDYRDGGQGQGYNDKSSGNNGDSNYRNDDVDIRGCDADGDGNKDERCVGWWEGDEWLAYRVNIESSGQYVFQVRGATGRDDVKLQFRIDDDEVGTVNLRNSGDASAFAVSKSDPVQLPEGRHTLKMKQAGGHSFDVDAIKVERTGDGGSNPTATPEPQPTQTPPPDNGDTIALPGTIEVEDYRDGGQDNGYYDKSSGNKGDSNYRNDDVDIRGCDADGDGNKDERCVGWWEGDEWLAYNVRIESNGEYVFRVRGATERDDVKLQFRIDGDTVGSVTLESTGSTSSFATSESDPIRLPEGRHTLKVQQADGHSFDLNLIKVERAGDGGGEPTPEPTNEPAPTAVPAPTDTGRSGRIDGANVYLSKQQIESIRDKVRSGDGPWQGYYDRLIDDARDALDAGPYSVTRNGGPDGEHNYFTELPYCGWKRVDGKEPDCRDGQINPQADRADYEAAIAVSRAVRDLGLAYALSGEERYAERAAYLIRVWAVDEDSRMNPRFTNGQSRIELSITMPGLFYGADLISGSSSWSSDEQRAFRSWVNEFVDSGKSWTGENNFEAWRLVFVASGAAYADDRGDLEYVYDRFKEILPEHIGSEGQMVQELGRTKSLMYSLYSLNAFTQVAEIARHNGEDLYGYSRNGRSLKLALDYHVPYVINPDRWQRQQISPIEPKDVAHYEMAYRYYGDEDYLQAINEWDRPLNETRTMGPVTLTHGR